MQLSVGLPHLAAAMLGLYCPLPTFAQSLPEPGTRVRAFARITGTDGVQGTVHSFSSDTLRVLTSERKARLVSIAIDSLWRLDTSAGYGSRLPAGTLGLAAGAMAIGFSTKFIVGRLQTNNPDCANCVFGPTPDETRRWAEEDLRLKNRAIMIGTVTGAVVGGWIGSRFRREYWRRVAVGNRFGIAPSSDGSVRLAVTMLPPRRIAR